MPLLNIVPIGEPLKKIFLTDQGLDILGFRPGEVITVRAGSSVTEAGLELSAAGNFVSSGTLKALELPETDRLRLVKKDNRGVQIGPLIGIMITQGKNRRIPPYSSQGVLLRKFAGYGLSTGSLVFVFAPNNVDTINNKIHGLYLTRDETGTVIWKWHHFPLPDIVYDRILFRTAEKRILTRNITSFLTKEKHIRYFNPKFLNKWETHSILSKNEALNRHLPDTRLYRDITGLADFLAGYETVYLKPVNGSLGQNIIRIDLVNTGISFKYRHGKKTVNGVWQTVDEMEKGLGKFLSKRPYIMQQGLNLIKFEDRVFDIRVLMQKNGDGHWVNSATVARVAPEGGIFPNVAAGGEPRNIDTLWKELTSCAWAESADCQLTEKISLVAADTLERALGTFGEIGLDIGIDNSGNVWIIEVNSKPSRKVFPKDQLNLKNLSITLPIDFAAHMAGFSSQGEYDPS
ncbi:MAG: hypothetical protein CVU89_14065 [Firmicutes bacterium HGW-Firmicutes-14]|nr:MAG: hypothetical protein CVU89_14065 [Firmicutes bacterium HGW-Firmicutes-14]